MKSIIIVLSLILACSNYAQTDAIDKVTEKYENEKGVTSVTITKDMFELFAKMDIGSDDEDGEEAELMNILKNLKEIRILTKEGDKGLVFFKEIKSSISTSGYKKMMEVNDSGEKVQFYVVEKDSKIEKFLLLVGSEDESVMIYIEGLIDLKSISKLAKGLNIDGLEKGMKKVNK